LDKVRVSEWSTRRFDVCALSLQKCRVPVVTARGVLYDKQSVLEYIVQQRAARRSQQRHQTHDSNSSSNNNNTDHNVSTTAATATAGRQASNFWLTGGGGQAGRDRAEMERENHADSGTVAKCVVTGTPLKAKELVAVRFKPRNCVQEHKQQQQQQQQQQQLFTGTNNNAPTVGATSTAASASNGGSNGDDGGIKWYYCCAVCERQLTNATSCYVMRESGHALCGKCTHTLALPLKTDPITNTPLPNPARDVIKLRSGGTSFAASAGDDLKVACSYRPGPLPNSA